MNDLKTELEECYATVKHIPTWWSRIQSYKATLKKRSKYYLNLRHEYGSSNPEEWKACIAMADALKFRIEDGPFDDFAMREHAKMDR